MKRRVCPHCGGVGQLYDDVAAGKELRTLRKRADISLRGMAKRLKISPAFLSRLETGEQHWSNERVKDFMRECNGR